MTISLRALGIVGARLSLSGLGGHSHRLTSSQQHSRPPPAETASGDDDVHRRHWPVVCADGRGARRPVSGRPAATGAAPTTSRASPTSPTSPARSGSASRTAPSSSARSWSTRASTATSGRSSRATPMSAASSIGIRAYDRGWTGDNVGDFFVRRASSTSCRKPTRSRSRSLSRGIVKLPTGDKDAGCRTGKTDFAFDFVASKETARTVEVAGYGGYRVPRRARRLRCSRTARSAGASAPASRRAARCAVTSELIGDLPFDDTRDAHRRRCVATDGSIAPLPSTLDSLTTRRRSA